MNYIFGASIGSIILGFTVFVAAVAYKAEPNAIKSETVAQRTLTLAIAACTMLLGIGVMAILIAFKVGIK